MGGIGLLLSTAWKSYEADKRIEGFSPYTLKAYGIQAKLLISYFKDPIIATFNTEGLKKYLVTQGKDLKPSSLAHPVYEVIVSLVSRGRPFNHKSSSKD